MGKAKRKRKNNKALKYIILLLAGCLLIGLYFFFGPNTGSLSNGEYLYIHTGSKYEQVKQALKAGGFVREINSFDIIAKRAGYPKHIHPGKYHITRGMSNYSMARLLRGGRQTPVKLVINKIRTEQEFVNIISQNLEADSAVLWHMLKDTTYLSQFGLDTNTALCGVMPNTYQFYWNTSADGAFKKIEKNYARFWSGTRKQQAKKEGLTPIQAIIIASIVEEETNNNDEKPNIASVYINRYKKNMKLQADPTIKYALKDFGLRRITANILETSSPYNTYMNSGLPPGPICTPGIASINAVLSAPESKYLYFCEKGDGSGTHLFAATYEDHLKNARAYHQTLDERNIH